MGNLGDLVLKFWDVRFFIFFLEDFMFYKILYFEYYYFVIVLKVDDGK